VGIEKCGVLHFGGINLRNGATTATLDHCRLLIRNHIRQIEWYHLRAPTTTGSALSELVEFGKLDIN